MPPWTDGDGRPDPLDDARIVQLIDALSALQQPARTLHTRIRAALQTGSPPLGESTRRNLENIAESCGLLGPSTTRAIRELVSVVERGGEHTDT